MPPKSIILRVSYPHPLYQHELLHFSILKPCWCRYSRYLILMRRKSKQIIFLRSHSQTVGVLMPFISKFLEPRAGDLDSCHQILHHRNYIICLILTGFAGLGPEPWCTSVFSSLEWRRWAVSHWLSGAWHKHTWAAAVHPETAHTKKEDLLSLSFFL